MPPAPDGAQREPERVRQGGQPPGRDTALVAFDIPNVPAADAQLPGELGLAEAEARAPRLEAGAEGPGAGPGRIVGHRGSFCDRGHVAVRATVAPPPATSPEEGLRIC